MSTEKERAMGELINDIDIAVAAWHEDGKWTVDELPDAQDIPGVIDALKAQPSNGGAIALLAIDEEFFMIVRVLGAHISLFLSDATCALDYECAQDVLELLDIDLPEENDEPGPAGNLDLLSDIGMSQMELETLCDDEELFPDEQLEAVASRLGFGHEFAELLEL